MDERTEGERVLAAAEGEGWFSPCPGLGLATIVLRHKKLLFGLVKLAEIVYKDINGKLYHTWVHEDGLYLRSA